MNRGWNKTIDLSLRWKEDWNDENVHELGKWVAEQIKNTIKNWDDYDTYGFELEEVVNGFEEGICTKQEALEINQDNYNFHLKQLAEGKESHHFDIVPIEEFDNFMSSLYDIADRQRWWIKTNF